jgi:hypothetical protein
MHEVGAAIALAHDPVEHGQDDENDGKRQIRRAGAPGKKYISLAMMMMMMDKHYEFGREMPILRLVKSFSL